CRVTRSWGKAVMPGIESICAARAETCYCVKCAKARSMTFSSPVCHSCPVKCAVCVVSCACCIESVYVCTPQNPTCGMTCIYMVWILYLRGKTAMCEHEKDTSFVERELQYVAALLILRKMRTEGII